MLIILILVLLFVFGGGGTWGYNRGYYGGQSFGLGGLVVLCIVLWLIFGSGYGPHVPW